MTYYTVISNENKVICEQTFPHCCKDHRRSQRENGLAILDYNIFETPINIEPS